MRKTPTAGVISTGISKDDDPIALVVGGVVLRENVARSM
jgi:hypothetical protein